MSLGWPRVARRGIPRDASIEIEHPDPAPVNPQGSRGCSTVIEASARARSGLPVAGAATARSAPRAGDHTAPMDFTPHPGPGRAPRPRPRLRRRRTSSPCEAEFERRGTLDPDATPRSSSAPRSRPASTAAACRSRSGGQGWTARGAGAGPRAAGPGDRRPVVVHPRRLQRARPLHARAAARYLDPSLRGERNGSYAITEAGQGSDARTLASTAVRDAADRRVRAQRREVVRHRAVGHRLHDLPLPRARAASERLPTLFLVDYDTPGLVLTHDPDYTHTFADRHPQFVLDRRPRPGRRGAGRRGRGRQPDQRVVRRGAAPHRGTLQRGDGAAADARGRVGDRAGPVRHSGSTTSRACRFPLADSAADAAAARLLTREAAS